MRMYFNKKATSDYLALQYRLHQIVQPTSHMNLIDGSTHLALSITIVLSYINKVSFLAQTAAVQKLRVAFSIGSH